MTLNDNCRHPLVERVADVFVPNDALLAGGRGAKLDKPMADQDSDDSSESNDNKDQENAEPCSVVLVTGANACGKVSV